MVWAAPRATWARAPSFAQVLSPSLQQNPKKAMGMVHAAGDDA
jgi:hypothetical protein